MQRCVLQPPCTATSNGCQHALTPAPAPAALLLSLLLPFQRGNAAYQAQQYRQALEAYSDALALNVEEPTLNAVLLCNRAAALHACGQYLEAIADCCMAAQLNGKYPRVLQVRLNEKNEAWSCNSCPAVHLSLVMLV